MSSYQRRGGSSGVSTGMAACGFAGTGAAISTNGFSSISDVLDNESMTHQPFNKAHRGDAEDAERFGKTCAYLCNLSVSAVNLDLFLTSQTCICCHELPQFSTPLQNPAPHAKPLP